MTNIKSINLTDRNQQVYETYFNKRGRGGNFSAWINLQMNKEFTLNPIEAINKQIEQTTNELRTLCEKREQICKKNGVPLILSTT